MTKRADMLRRKVEAIAGEQMRFRVESKSAPKEGPQLVDLLANGGRGECSCIGWSCATEAEAWPASVARCCHIQAARDHFVSDLLAVLAVELRR